MHSLVLNKVPTSPKIMWEELDWGTGWWTSWLCGFIGALCRLGTNVTRATVLQPAGPARTASNTPIVL